MKIQTTQDREHSQANRRWNIVSRLIRARRSKQEAARSARERVIPTHLEEAAQADLKQLFASLDTSEEGLSPEAVEQHRERHGLNEVTHEKPPRWYVLLLKNFYNPFVALLIVLAVVSYFLEDIRAVIILSIMVAISVLMRFVQEYRAGKAAQQLSSLVQTKATVQRGGTKSEMPLIDLVPGDIVFLMAGDMVPADVRLIAAKDLFISQSALTGESLPVEKYDTLGAVVEKHALELSLDVSDVLETPNIALMGTNVVSGAGTAVVVATGDRTLFGSMARDVAGYRSKTSFDRGVNSVSWLLIRFVLVMIPVVLLLNGFTKGNWLEAAMFALSVAVGLTPEMLPMIVTANLALGALKLSRQKVIVKRLNAIQNLGAIDVLCTDKTGTLTEDKVILEYHLDLNGHEDEGVLEYAYLNSYYQTGLKSLLDHAVLSHEDLVASKQLTKRYLKTDEIPFDFQRRRMSVAVHQVSNGNDLLITKGAVEELLAISSRVRLNDQTFPLTLALKDQALDLATGLNEDGLRVVAVAYKELYSDLLHKPRTVADENEMTLVGYIAFLDPPKESAGKAIRALKEHGVLVKVLTGDNEVVTRRICRWVNLEIEEMMLGQQIERLTEEELAVAAQRVTVFAKMNPLQKTRVIRALQLHGHTVGYLGDGINDAPALRDADVGISVDTAVDIAKESADIILLEKSLLVLEEGVLEGRKVFGNIIKYIKMTASSNFGNVFSVIGPSAILPFLPMEPIQLLTQNLLYDISQTVIPFDHVDREFIEKPRKWDASGIGRFMFFIGPISSIFDFAMFGVLWFLFHYNSVADKALFQAGWFVEGLLSQTLIVHLIRTQRIPFVQSRAAFPLILTTMAIIAIGIYIPFSTFGNHIGLLPLPGAYFIWLALILLCYCLLTQVVKMWFVRKFEGWL